MSSVAPPTAAVFDWADGALRPVDGCDAAPAEIVAADSWLVEDGFVRGLALHRERFLSALPSYVHADGFWAAALDAVPREGAWFPRVELERRRGTERLRFRQRSAPPRSRSVRLATSPIDPRRFPSVKGPDLGALSHLRTAVQARGADEAVLLSGDGHIVEGAYSALLWWRGDAICVPPQHLQRVDSVTERSVLALATALGVEVRQESAEPHDLEGCEIWTANALHGIRIVTAWIDGPQPAQEPGRLALWRARLGRLTRALDSLGE